MSHAAAGLRHGVEQTRNDSLLIDAFRLGEEVGNDPVSQGGMSEGTHVPHRHMVASLHQRPRLPSEDQCLGRPQTSAPLDPFLDELRCVGPTRARRINETNRIPGHLVRHDHLTNQPLKLQDVLAVEDAIRRPRLVGCRRRHDAHLIILR